MYKSEITAVFLAAILFTGALTAAIPSFMGNAEASGDKKDKYASSDYEKDYKYKEKYGYSDSKEKTSGDKKDKYASSDYEKDYKYKEKYGYSDPKETAYSDKKYGDYNYESSSYDKSSKMRDKYDKDDKDSHYDKYSRDYDKKSTEYKDAYSKGTGTYDKPYSYGQVYTKPSYGSDYNDNYDKKIIKKIVVVSPDGSKIPIKDEENGYNNPRGVSGGAENGFIDNVIERVCPAIDSCDECFDWLLNFVDNRTEAVEVVNTVIEALNNQTDSGPLGKPDLDTVEFGADGYEGPNLWEICDFFNSLLEDSTYQGNTIENLINYIEDAVETGDITAVVGALSIDIIECIAELEGIELPITPTTGNEPNQQIETEIPSFTTETIR
jgi:hypothetical protein